MKMPQPEGDAGTGGRQDVCLQAAAGPTCSPMPGKGASEKDKHLQGGGAQRDQGGGDPINRTLEQQEEPGPAPEG
jgi:hypothetical protein